MLWTTLLLVRAAPPRVDPEMESFIETSSTLTEFNAHLYRSNFRANSRAGPVFGLMERLATREALRGKILPALRSTPSFNSIEIC